MKSATTVTDLDLKLSPEVLRIREKLRKLKEDPNTKPLDRSKFHFDECREALKHYKGNLSDAVYEEREEW